MNETPLQPIGDTNDADLRRRIISYLEQRRYPTLRDLTIFTDNGSVTLQGKLDSFYEKQICLSTCQRVAGVIRIIDEMEVANATTRQESGLGRQAN